MSPNWAQISKKKESGFRPPASFEDPTLTNWWDPIQEAKARMRARILEAIRYWDGHSERTKKAPRPSNLAKPYQVRQNLKALGLKLSSDLQNRESGNQFQANFNNSPECDTLKWNLWLNLRSEGEKAPNKRIWENSGIGMATGNEQKRTDITQPRIFTPSQATTEGTKSQIEFNYAMQRVRESISRQFQQFSRMQFT